MDAKSVAVAPLSANHTQPATNPKGGIMKTSKFAHIIAICFCIALFSQFAQSEQPGAKAQPKGSVLNPPVSASAVGVQSVTANGKTLKNDEPYKGSCPVTMVFTFLVQATEPTTIKYHIVRSDKSHHAPETVKVPKANAIVPVPYSWELGAGTAEFKDFTGSVSLVIDSPKGIGSDQSKVGDTFYLKCKQGN